MQQLIQELSFPLLLVGMFYIVTVPVMRGLNAYNEIGTREKRWLLGGGAYVVLFGYSVIALIHRAKLGLILVIAILSFLTWLLWLVLRKCYEFARREEQERQRLIQESGLQPIPEQVGRGKKIFRGFIIAWGLVNIIGVIVAIILKVSGISPLH